MEAQQRSTEQILRQIKGSNCSQASVTNQFAAKITLPKFNYLSGFFPREPSEEVRLQRSHAAGHMNKGGLQLTVPQLTDQFT